MFGPKAVRPGELMAPNTLLGGGKRNVPQILKGIAPSACLLAWPDVGFQYEQS
jgi:hypothetical protein